ncbi:MAG: response regulator transcription factor [Aliarcobacter sp.]
MKIIVFSSKDFIIKKFQELKTEKTIIFVKNEMEIFNLKNDEKFIIFHHLDSDDNFKKTFQEVNETYNCNFLALRNNTNNIEGCSLLKKGYKAYIHSLSNIKIIESALNSVLNGNTWIYPELMEFLINSIPLNDKKEKNLFENLSIKEIEVLELVAQGLTNNKIAETLNIAEVTVKKHISSLFKKLEVKDRLALALAFKNYK